MRESKALLPLILICLFGIAVLLLLIQEPAADARNLDSPSTSSQALPEDMQARDLETPTTKTHSQTNTTYRRTEIAHSGSTITGRITRKSGTVAGLHVEIHGRPRDGHKDPIAHGSSDTNGEFQFSELDPGQYRVGISGEAVPNNLFYPWVTLSKDQEFDLGTLHIPVPASIRGRVVNRQGAPLAGMRVYLSQDARSFMGSFNRQASPGSADTSPNILTDVDGRFAFTGLLATRTFILIESEEYADTAAKAEIKEGQVHDLGDLRPRRGYELRGRIIAPDGSPIAGALVAPGKKDKNHFLRKGVRSAADGSFHLRGLGAWRVDSILVSAEGYTDSQEDWHYWNKEPLIVQMRSSLALNGRVVGAGKAHTTVTLLPELYWELPPSLISMMGQTIEVAADGRFLIEDLQVGNYKIVAKANGVGTSNPQFLNFQEGVAPLVLEIQNFERVIVLVRDLRGDPLEGAEVTSIAEPIYKNGYLTWPTNRSEINTLLNATRLGGTRVQADDAGRAALTLDPGTSLGVAASMPGYIPTGGSFAAGQIPDPIELVMAQAARIEGIVDDASGRERFSIGVRMSFIPDPSAGGATSFYNPVTPIDAKGRFVLEPLAPGKYQISIYRKNRTGVKDPTKRLANVTPLLGAGLDMRSSVTIDVKAGEVAKVELKVAPLGVIRGKVLVQGRPLAGAYVYERSNDNYWRSPDQENVHESLPHTKTGEDGRFEFHYGDPRSFKLYARHPDAAFSSLPVTVTATAHAQEIEQNIEMPAAEIRGQLDVQSFTSKQRKMMTAYLFRRSLAGTDPFYSPHHGSHQTWGMKELNIGKDGKFSFPYLTKGDWVLRITTLMDEMLYQQPIHTERGQVIDLGPFGLRSSADVELEVTIPSEGKFHGLWIHRLYQEGGDPVFARTAKLGNGKAVMAGLPTGRYRAELMGTDDYWDDYGFGLSGNHSKKFAEFEVHADGTVTPAKLVF